MAPQTSRGAKNPACGERIVMVYSQNSVAVCKPFFYIVQYGITLK
jgi:hypothetical protein